MVFENKRIQNLSKKLLLEEAKSETREKIRKAKEVIKKEAMEVKLFEKELIRRIKAEKSKGLTMAEKQKVIQRKKNIMKAKQEIKKGLKSLAKDTKKFLKGVFDNIQAAQRKKDMQIKKAAKRKKNRMKKKAMNKKKPMPSKKKKKK